MALELSQSDFARLLEASTSGPPLSAGEQDLRIKKALEGTQPPPPPPVPPSVGPLTLKVTPDGTGATVVTAPVGTKFIHPAWSTALTGGTTEIGEYVPYPLTAPIPAKAGYPYIGAHAADASKSSLGEWAIRVGPTGTAPAPAPGPTPPPTPTPAPSGLIVAADIYQLSPNSEKGAAGIKAGPDVSACVKHVRMCGTSRGSTAAVLSNAELEAWKKIGCGVIITDFNGGMTVGSISPQTWADRFVMRQLVNPDALEEGNELYEAPWGPNQTAQAAIDAYFARLEATRVAMDKAYGRGHYAPLLVCCQGSEKMFWTNALAAKGLKDVVDGAVCHCYPKESQNESTGKSLSFERVHEVHQATGLPIWVTEFGAECPGKFTPEGQAKAIKEFVEKCRAAGTEVRGISNYAYEERGENFGLVNKEWHHKPAYSALQSVA